MNGTAVPSGAESDPILILPGSNVITIVVTEPGGTPQTYLILVDRVGPEGQEAYLKASNTDASDNFGNSVAISGNTIVVGAIYEASKATGINGIETNNSARSSGAVYVFTRSGGVWAQEAYLKASNAEVDDLFGSSVAISGDTIVVGAEYEDSNATGINGIETNGLFTTNSGASYVFTRTAGGWTQEA